MFSASEISAFHQQFSAADKDGKGTIHQADLSTVAPKAGEAVQNVISKLSTLKLFDNEGDVSFESFLTVSFPHPSLHHNTSSVVFEKK
jgi:Ca2+-binding EF-hand superfamily protein